MQFLNQREDPGTSPEAGKNQGGISPAVRSMQEGLSQDFSASVHSLIASVEKGKEPKLKDIGLLARTIQNLSYHEYLIVDGYLRNLSSSQKGKTVPPFKNEAGLKQPNVAAFIQAFKALENTDSSSAKEAIILLRAICPYGKNIANVRLDEQEGKINFETTIPCTIHWAGANIVLVPTNDPNTMTVTLGSQTCQLKEGTPLILGRELIRNELFGVQLPRDGTKEAIGIRSPIFFDHQNNSRISRAAIMVAIHDGKLYIFDKASANKILVHQQNIRVKYNPTVVSADGVHGGSEIDRIPFEGDASE